MRSFHLSVVRSLVLAATLLVTLPGRAVVHETPKPVKNVILCISDGTSLATLSLARWYQRLTDAEKQNLLIDPYLCGTILTYCSDSPIGDSAPTTSTYMNGVPGLAGQVSTYPVLHGEADLLPYDSLWQRRPLVPLWQALRMEQGRKTGIVVTCEFPHATPADCTSSSYKRSKYSWIVPQMVHNQIDVLYGGGASLMKPEYRKYLEERGWSVFTDPGKAALDYQGERVWGLFAPMDMPFDIDRDPAVMPSLEEMTKSALRILDTNNDKGFVLMIEGSKVDWAAHANDPVGMATEFLGFDRAVKAAIDFAKKDGNTVVLMTADHGNSGISLGTDNLGHTYAETPASKLFGPITDIKLTATGLAECLIANPEEDIEQIWEEVTTRELPADQLPIVRALRQYEVDSRTAATQPAEVRKKVQLSDYLSADLVDHLKSLYASSLAGYICRAYTDMTYIVFTTHGHTGEEVFLGCYHPDFEKRLIGFNTNLQLHDYLRTLTAMPQTMKELSDKYFAPHTEVFAGCKMTLKGDRAEDMVLTVKKGGHTYVIPAFSTLYTVDGKQRELPIATVYNDENRTLYLPRTL